MKSIVPLTLLAIAAAAHPVAAQQAEPEDTTIADRVGDAVSRGGFDVALDSIGREVGPDLHDALDEVIAEIAVVAERIATDRELRFAAIRTAEGLIEVAQVVLEERSGKLEEALNKIADRLERLDTSESDSAVEP